MGPDRQQRTDAATPSARRGRGALRITAWYAVVGILWILLSSEALPLLFGHDLPPWLESSKGVLFVLATAAVLYAVTSRELRARRVVEEGLREANDALHALVDASPLPTLTLDLEGRVRLWNAAAERAFGWTAEEAIGRVLPIVPEDRLDEFHALRARGLAGQPTAGVIVHRRRKDGCMGEVAVWSAPLTATDGTVRGEIAVLEDVTERRRAEAALRESEERLRQSQKMEAIGRLAGGLAHDLNNLLTAIIGFTELLREDLPPDHPLDANAREILRASERAAGLTRQLLAFSRKQVLQPASLDLSEVARGLAPMLRRLLGEDVTVELALADGLFPVHADRTQVEQVLMNLAVNARDAMPAGGTLTIATANAVTLGPEAADATPPGEWACLRVSDTGHGMTPEVRAHLFEPYFTTKDSGKGTGLGLSTVYGIVTQSGGHVSVTSEPGAGATFEVFLPRRIAGRPVLVEAGDEPTAPGGPESILVVEDEQAVRHLVTGVLRARGFRVLEAKSGREGLDVAATQPDLDLLITDVIMPGMSGRELAEELVRMRPGLRVLYVSGFADDVLPEHDGLPAGTGFLAKPFTPAALARKVREMLDASAGERITES